MMKTLLLIDGNALMHRAYHALPAFTTKAGIPTNAVYGFLSILHKAITDSRPQYLIVCFDTPVPTFRKKLFQEYQSHRPKIEDQLSIQFPTVKEGLDKAGIIHLEKEGYEADDVIGTISKLFAEKNNRVLILSGDKDILQLVNDRILVITPQLGFGKEKIYDAGGVKERFGIKPNQIPDFKALMGDQSDNYKGAKGIGPKTAAKLLNEYGSIDNIFKHLNSIESKVRDLLKTHKKNILMSHKLATILTNVEVKLDSSQSQFNGYNESLKEFLQKYEMSTLLKRMFNASAKMQKQPEKNQQKKDEDENQIGLF